MNLIDRKSGNKLDGIIEQINSDDLKNIRTNDNFNFNWDLESKHLVFKIRLIENKEILGLISLIDLPNEFRIHINLIESSKIYRGRNKDILNIAACLIAFSCKLAFKLGYDGFVSLLPKTQLLEYYSKNFGFIQIGTQMAVFDHMAESLIQKFIGDETI